MRKVKESIRTPQPARTRKPSKGQQVGYLRVSPLDQNEVRQLEGLTLNKRFTDVTRHSNRGKCTVRPRNCSQIAEFRACLYSNRGQSGWERTPHRTSLSSWCARPLLPPSVVRCDSSGLLESVPQSAGALPAAEPRGMDAQVGDRTHQWHSWSRASRSSPRRDLSGLRPRFQGSREEV